ncbi:MAG: hypothetical protein COB20_16515 [SAR86 cluster bacterium]|uniref:Uncharacterized protein n=1 Tax=SAR86 cluster bacterium TaxID=2030880 RepID=A0A2A4WSY0_9GAMM|nr:MAG: hypothetical protein COB20_16515 [SAR86 cluster bacterium]
MYIGHKFLSMLSRFSSIRVVALVTSSLFLASCAGTYLGERPANNLYCANFVLYEMCALDSNRDGIVDYTYFQESKEIFMYRNRLPRRIPSGFRVHRCAMPMEEDLVVTTSRVFYIDDSSSLLEKTDIRGAMMLKYMTKLPEVTACNMRADEALADD